MKLLQSSTIFKQQQKIMKCLAIKIFAWNFCINSLFKKYNWNSAHSYNRKIWVDILSYTYIVFFIVIYSFKWCIILVYTFANCILIRRIIEVKKKKIKRYFSQFNYKYNSRYMIQFNTKLIKTKFKISCRRPLIWNKFFQHSEKKLKHFLFLNLNWNFNCSILVMKLHTFKIFPPWVPNILLTKRGLMTKP